MTKSSDVNHFVFHSHISTKMNTDGDFGAAITKNSAPKHQMRESFGSVYHFNRVLET